MDKVKCLYCGRIVPRYRMYSDYMCERCVKSRCNKPALGNFCWTCNTEKKPEEMADKRTCKACKAKINASIAEIEAKKKPKKQRIKKDSLDDWVRKSREKHMTYGAMQQEETIANERGRKTTQGY